MVRNNKTLKLKLFLWILVPAFGIISAKEIARAEEILYDARGKRDPFIPLVSTSGRSGGGLLNVDGASDLAIEGIVYDPKGSIVIVNGSLMKEGDLLGGVKVLKIRRDGVLFSINDTEIFKPLYQNEDQKGKLEGAS